MIEIIYREDDNSSEEISVRLPKNIRQVGDTKGNKKVYFEEQVLGMIKEKQHYGVLLGKVKRVGSCAYLFINGAISAVNDGKNIDFGDRVWANIYDDLHTYFHNTEIVGWFVSEECKIISLDNIKKIQLDNFPGNDKVCILNDISENEENIYQYNNGVIENVGGYYVYFDKNPDFEKYLLRKRALDELFEEEQNIEEKKPDISDETKKEPDRKWNFKGMVPSYLVIALLLAVIAVMNNNNQIKSIKTSLSDIAGNLVSGPVTEADSDDARPVVEQLPGNVDTTTEKKEPAEKNTTKIAKEETTKKKTTKKKTTEKKTTEKKTTQRATEAKIKPVSEVRYYTVKPGETLSDISRKIYNNLTKIDEIKKINKIKDGNLIYEGQKIILP